METSNYSSNLMHCSEKYVYLNFIATTTPTTSCKSGGCITGVTDGTGACTADISSTDECENVLPLVCKSDGVSDSYEHTTSIGCSNCGGGIQSICSWSCSYCKATSATTVTTTVATTTTSCKKKVAILKTN